MLDVVISEAHPGNALHAEYVLAINGHTVATGPAEDIWTLRKAADGFLVESTALDDLSGGGIILPPRVRERVSMMLARLRGSNLEDDDTPERYVYDLIEKDLEERMGVPLRPF